MTAAYINGYYYIVKITYIYRYHHDYVVDIVSKIYNKYVFN